MTLTKITANYTEAAVECLADAVRLGRDNQTDTLNRAIRIYATLLREVAPTDWGGNGKKISVHDDEPVTVTVNPDGTATIDVNYETINILI